MNSDARVVRGVNIAALVLTGLSLFCAVAFLIFLALSSSMLTDPRMMADIVDQLESTSSAFDSGSYSPTYDYGGLTPEEASGLATAGFITLIILIVGLIVLKLVALIAAIKAVRNYSNPARFGRIFGWAIAASIVSLLSGSWISLVLFVISAIFAHRAKKSAAMVGGGYDVGAQH